MAFTRFPDPTNNISNLANQPVEPPATLKQKFDQIGEDLKDWNNNTFLPELESITNGDSGADNIGATPVGAGVADDVQGILEELDAKIDTQLPTPDGSITDAKLSNIAGQIKDVVSTHTRQISDIMVSVKDFGAIGDGATNDSQAFNDAVLYASTNKKNVYVPFTTNSYLLESPVLLPSKIKIFGSNSVLQAKRNVGTTGGAFPSLIFRNSDFVNGNTDIEIEGITFRGIWKNDLGVVISSAISVASTTNESNLLRFEKVEELIMKNCVIENHTSNYASSDDGFSAMHTKNSKNLYYYNLKHIDSSVEAMNWVDCTNVVLDKFYTKNSECWSSVKFWYCDGVKLLNSEINEDVLGLGTGSMITTFSKNFIADNTSFKGGAFVNIANERNEKVFDVDDIVISNCTIDSTVSGTNHSGGYLGNLYKSVKIVNTSIKSVNFGITAKTDFLLVDGCTITTTDKSSEGVRNIDCKSTVVNNCKIKSGCGIKTTIALVVTELDNITATNNLIELLSLSGADSYEGYGTAFNVRNGLGLVVPSNVKSVLFYGNLVLNAEGGFVTHMIDSPNLMNIENFIVKDNIFKGGVTGALRGITINKSKKVVIESNTCVDIGASLLIDINSFTIKGNRMYNSLSAISRGSTFTTLGTFDDVIIIEDNVDKNSDNFMNKSTATITPTVLRNQNNIPKENIGLTSTKYGLTSTRPAVKGIGDFYYDVTINKAIWWNGANWVDSNGSTV